MSTDYLVTGEFTSLDTTIAAVKSIRKEGLDDSMDVYSSFPDHDLEDAIYEGKRRSPVRMFVLLGGLTGCIGAFIFTSWMSIDYPIRVSAKPLISFPAFVVIAFECTILLGALSNITSMFHFSRIPNIFRPAGYRPHFSAGHFGISIRVPKEDADEVKKKLESYGAEEVEAVYVR